MTFRKKNHFSKVCSGKV